MVRTTLCTGIVFVVNILVSLVALGDDSCQFLSTDYPKIAQENRSGEMWDYEHLVQFLSSQSRSHARLLISNENQVCVAFQDLPAAETLRVIQKKVESQASVHPDDWRRFLSALELLTCAAINERGRPIACPSDRLMQFIDGARRAALLATSYDPSYARIDTINGDIPANRGVCSDVVVRGLRDAGMDLQNLVYQDMRRRFHAYQNLQQNQLAPDRNIDHRRVTNLMVYFNGDQDHFLTITPPDADWQPGDIVAWDLIDGRGFLAHIGVVSDRRGPGGEYLVIHHLPVQGREDEMLHGWTIIGHFRPLLED